MEIQNYKKQYIILIRGGVKEIVGEDVADKVKKLKSAGAGGFDLPNGNFYACDVVQSIISLDDYYSQFPDKKPHVLDYFPIKKDITIKLSKEKRLKAINQMIGGYENSGSSKDILIYKKMQQKLKDAEKEPDGYEDNIKETLKEIIPF